MVKVDTPSGELRCYVHEGEDDPGFSIYFVPKGSDEEINVAILQAGEKDKLKAYVSRQYIECLPW